MGSKLSKFNGNLPSILSEGDNWQPKSKESLCPRWINTKTKEQANQAIIFYENEEECERQINLYQYRKNSPNFIRAMHVEILRDNVNCYSSIRCRVLIESAKAKLEALSLSEGQLYYALFQCLLGFQQLYSKFGYIQIERDMIVVNSAGKVRVWMSKAYTKNSKDEASHVACDSILKRKKNPQKIMVQKIIRIVSKQSELQRLRQLNFEGSFKEALRYFEEEVTARDITVSKRIRLSDKKQCRETQTLVSVKSTDTFDTLQYREQRTAKFQNTHLDIAVERAKQTPSVQPGMTTAKMSVIRIPNKVSEFTYCKQQAKNQSRSKCSFLSPTSYSFHSKIHRI